MLDECRGRIADEHRRRRQAPAWPSAGRTPVLARRVGLCVEFSILRSAVCCRFLPFHASSVIKVRESSSLSCGSAGSAAFPALASPRHRLGIILLASTKWSSSPQKAPKGPISAISQKLRRAVRPATGFLFAVRCPALGGISNAAGRRQSERRRARCRRIRSPSCPLPCFSACRFPSLLFPSKRRDGFGDGLIFEFSESPQKSRRNWLDVSRDGCC